MKCIHLDFRTGPDIKDIGKNFDKKKFTETLKAAKVDLMTVFAKCHHGYTYYPSKVCEMHPGLDFDLLGAEIEAIHDAGAKAPIYITMGWSKKDADEHPEWHSVHFDKGRPSPVEHDPEEPIPDTTWTLLCPNTGYRKMLVDITHEVCSRYDVSDGIFYDICFGWSNCVCDSCKEKMIKKGYDPTVLDDVKKFYTEERIELMKELTGIVQSYKKDARVFYNGGASRFGTPYHPYQTHYELEDLPTAWGGYDKMPINAKFFERYGKEIVGMTGKFHHAWGEFGGFKSKEALKYECADMVSVGASISVGDHLHPLGELDEGTYELVGDSFRYIDSIEEYCDNTKAHTDLAIWLSGDGKADMGASKVLSLMHLEYDVLTSGDDPSPYRCVILPDKVGFSENDKAAFIRYLEGGGRIVASYASVFDELGIKKIAPSPFNLDYIKSASTWTTPFLSYSASYVTESDGEVLATIHNPYFNRTYGHFCGHKNTPNRPEAATHPALIRKGNLLYFAHSVFSAYESSGNHLIYDYVSKGIRSIYEPLTVTENLPSCGRLRLRINEEKKFFALHLLYSPPVNRGNVCILCDFPTLHDVKVKIRTEKEIEKVFSAPDMTPVEFTREGDYVVLSLPPFSLHKLIVLKYR